MGYYVFYVRQIKINGKWNYRHIFPDSISNCIVANAIYVNEYKTTVEKFLRESSINENKITITTDLDEKIFSNYLKFRF